MKTRTITFEVSGTPKGQPRPRAFARKFGDKWMARVYDAGTAEGWKSEIAIAAKPHAPESPIEGPISLNIEFRMPRPASHSNKKGLKETAPHLHTGKPDCDNLAKAVLDAMTNLGFWKDDAQIAKLNIVKIYAPGRFSVQPTGATITIEHALTETQAALDLLAI